MKKTIAILLTLITAVILVGCATDKQTYTISVYDNDKIINNYFIESNEIFTKDKLDGLITDDKFKFWSTSKYGVEYSFDIKITSDLNLYAVYKTENNNGDGGDNGNNNNNHSIDFSLFNGYYNALSTDFIASKLKSELAKIISTGTNIGSYDSKNWSTLKKADLSLNSTSTVWLIYSGEDRSVNMSGGSKGQWNKEHVMAKSWLENNGYTGFTGDQHNLRAADVSVNSGRGNKRFTDGSGSYKNGGTFYPGDDHRGDVARILLYGLVKYPNIGINKMIDGNTPWDVLLKWHLEDPVDEFEIRRNNVIFKDQGNRNPFIDYPSLVYLIWPEHYQK